MNEVYIAITEYLKQKSIPKNLVLRFEQEPDPEKMAELGFRKENEFWIISRKDAEAALLEILGVSKPFDWGTHWKQEGKRSLG